MLGVAVGTLVGVRVAVGTLVAALVAVGMLVAIRVAVGTLVGVRVAVAAGVVAVGLTLPPHTTPLTVKLIGTAKLPVVVAVKPKLWLPPAAMLAFQSTFLALTCVPLWVKVAFHIWPICWPLAALQATVQPLIALVPVLRTTTSA